VAPKSALNSSLDHVERLQEARDLLIARIVDALRDGYDLWSIIGIVSGEHEIPAPARAALGVLLRNYDTEAIIAALDGSSDTL
jgi:hypothetical protein